MQFKKDIIYIILIMSIFVFAPNYGRTETMQASYQDIQPDIFMRSWDLLGPIPVSSEKKDSIDLDTQKKAFETEFFDKDNIKLETSVKIEGKEYNWQYYESKDDIVDLTKVFGEKNYVITYALAEINSSEDKSALFGIGSDDGVKIWLNGKLVHENWTGRSISKDNDIVSIKLQKGKNQILIKVQNMTGNWEFCCRMLGKESLKEKLIESAGRGDLDEIETLLSYGTDVNATIEPGLTALHKAKMAGRKDAVELLLKKGADPNIKMPDKEKLADAVFNKVFKEKSPGASVLVSRDGKIIYSKGFGYADIGNRVPFKVETKSRVGSITKQFTASAILKLQEEGKLSVNDKLSKFLPDFPRGDEVTIHHLLNHTSGIHSYTSKHDFTKTVNIEVKPEEVIDLFKNDPFDFDPGEKFLYNNSGYFLLGYIVEKVSGQSLDDYLRNTFFKPLGMNNTGIHKSKPILENEAYGYAYEGGGFVKAVNWDMSRAGGAGALYSTAYDLYLWNEGIFGGKVLNETSLKSAFTPGVLNDGKKVGEEFGGYGYGWFISEDRGLRMISHGGGLEGFNSELRRYPDINVTICVLQNCVPPGPGMFAGGLANQISEIFLWEDMKPQESFRVDKAVAVSKYDDYAGKYDYGGSIMTIRREGDRLFAKLATQPEFEIFPKSENEFFWKVVDAQITFVRDENGKVVYAIHRQAGREFQAPKMKEEKPAKIDPAIYDQYAGQYEFPNVGILTVTKEGDKLFAQMVGQPKLELLPRSESEFFSDIVIIKVNFIKDDNGNVRKMTINQSGMQLEGTKK